ncbi:MAG TPA: NADH-quinone oxidoreductase subunit C [Dehalococcoidia bacterium]|nr:NADH-quinone oxidoreductase subunit C [Dehalococcoidia bacterium]
MADETTASPRHDGAIAEVFQTVLPDVEFAVAETASDIALTIDRADLERVMAAARENDRLAFDFLRCVSGVDQISALESVYHLYSFKWGHSVAIKVRCTPDDPHIPTVSHIWQAANWLERETAELFGIVYDGHPDPRPLLTEEGLGYYILRKSHPLAPIEEWQEDFLKEIQEAQARMATAAGPAATAPIDERALKIQQAQQKAAIMKKAREEARARGLSGAEEKEAVTAALRAWEEEQAAAATAAPAAAAAPAAPASDTASKIKQAQAKAAVMKKARDEARMQGLSPEEEKAAVRAALDEYAKSQAAPPAAPAPVAAAAPAAAAPMDRAAKIALAQKKAAAIKNAREQARMQGLGPEEERKMVQEALQKVAEEG